MKRRRAVLVMVLAFSLLAVSWAGAEIAGLSYYREGGLTTLAGTGDYKWWYGCSPTSAGMMMGYYDRNGYSGLSYSNLVPGVAEANTYGGLGSGYKVNNIIASQGHVNDFYGGGYKASGDDVTPPLHTFNSLADFMGTSQDSVGNKNGYTTFYFYTNGTKLTAADAFTLGVSNNDGMYGMYEYFGYAGYGSGGNSGDGNFFSQLIEKQATQGFTFTQYMAEIDAGREVMIHLKGHSMVGHGYDDTNGLNKVYVYDTWNLGGGVMDWGGNYGGMDQLAVTCFTPSGGQVPLPSSLLLMISGLAGLVGFRFRK